MEEKTPTFVPAKEQKFDHLVDKDGSEGSDIIFDCFDVDVEELRDT